MLGKGPGAQAFIVMSSSESGPDYENLVEAIDPDFLTNGLFGTKDKSKDLVKPLTLPASVRKVSNSSYFNPLEIKATPEFRAHVSKCLRKKLDKVIDDTQELPENNRKKCRKKSKGGHIKLLRTSSNYLTVSDEETPVVTDKKPKRVKRRRENDSSSSSSSSSDNDEERAKEVAVTAEWITSGKATEGWATSTRGKLEVISIPVSKS